MRTRPLAGFRKLVDVSSGEFVDVLMPLEHALKERAIRYQRHVCQVKGAHVMRVFVPAHNLCIAQTVLAGLRAVRRAS